MQILCHHHEVSPIIYHFSAQNTILVKYDIDYGDNYCDMKFSYCPSLVAVGLLALKIDAL